MIPEDIRNYHYIICAYISLSLL